MEFNPNCEDPSDYYKHLSMFWNDIIHLMSSKPQALASVGPMRAFAANSKKIVSEMIDLNDDLVIFNKHLAEYYAQLTETWNVAQKKVNLKAPDVPQDVEQAEAFKRIWVDIFDNDFTDLFNSLKFGDNYGKLVSKELELVKHWNNMANIILQSVNLPSKEEIDEVYKEIHSIKKRLRTVEMASQKIKYDSNTVANENSHTTKKQQPPDIRTTPGTDQLLQSNDDKTKQEQRQSLPNRQKHLQTQQSVKQSSERSNQQSLRYGQFTQQDTHTEQQPQQPRPQQPRLHQQNTKPALSMFQQKTHAEPPLGQQPRQRRDVQPKAGLDRSQLIKKSQKEELADTHAAQHTASRSSDKPRRPKPQQRQTKQRHKKPRTPNSHPAQIRIRRQQLKNSHSSTKNDKQRPRQPQKHQRSQHPQPRHHLPNTEQTVPRHDSPDARSRVQQTGNKTNNVDVQ